jgi:hypothetical protein
MIVSNHNTLSISRPQECKQHESLAIHRSIYPIKKPHLITARADINLPLPEQNRTDNSHSLLNTAQHHPEYETMRPTAPRNPTAGPDTGPEQPFPIRLSGPVIRGFGRGSKEVCPP